MLKNYKRILIVIFAVLGVCSALWFVYHPSLERMIGQMIITGFHGNGQDVNSPEFVAISNQIRDGQIGGVILFDVDVHGLLKSGKTIDQARQEIFSSNIQNLPQLQEMLAYLSALSSNKLLVAVDQEGGAVQRLKPQHGFVDTPSAKDLGQGTSSVTYQTAYKMGQQLSRLGINVNFAPSLDVDINPASPAIGARGRSFSSDPDIVSLHGDAFARGLSDAGVAFSFKHFPGHGSAGTDSHLGLTDITETYSDTELYPWRTLLADASDKAMVMVAHVVNRNWDDVPASLSSKIIKQIRDMGFEGVIVSDDMDMGAIVNQYGTYDAVLMAINAGNDILVFGNNLTYDANRGRDIHAMILDMVHSGKISKRRIRASYRRIMRLKRALSAS